jgi:hypothetical protein
MYNQTENETKRFEKIKGETTRLANMFPFDLCAKTSILTMEPMNVIVYRQLLHENVSDVERKTFYYMISSSVTVKHGKQINITRILEKNKLLKEDLTS